MGREQAAPTSDHHGETCTVLPGPSVFRGPKENRKSPGDNHDELVTTRLHGLRALEMRDKVPSFEALLKA